MKRSTLVVSLIAATAPWQAVSATTAAPDVCALLTEAKATQLLGGPVGETAQSQVAAADDNGGDRQSACGRFPKGYKLEGAEAPPERGILVELHTLRDAGAARGFYGGILDMQKQMGGAAISMVGGLGDGAYRKPTVLPGSKTTIVTLTVLKGSTVASVQVWTGGSAAAAESIARSVATDIVPKLP